MSLLSVANVSRQYRSFSLIGRAPAHRVLHDVSLEIGEGETVALVGRSGCGKSTLARLLTALERPDGGEIRFRGKALGDLGREGMADFRRQVQMVFQDSLSAVDPRQPVARIVDEPLRHLCGLAEGERAERVAALLGQVGLDPAMSTRLPAQMSGGQLQRVCIARALASHPRLVILDEAVSNLDLHLQIQTLELLERLRAETGVAFLFVTHDLRLVRRFCARALVMSEGRIVEEVRDIGGAEAFSHPAARELEEAVLPPYPRARRRA